MIVDLITEYVVEKLFTRKDTTPETVDEVKLAVEQQQMEELKEIYFTEDEVALTYPTLIIYRYQVLVKDDGKAEPVVNVNGYGKRLFLTDYPLDIGVGQTPRMKDYAHVIANLQKNMYDTFVPALRNNYPDQPIYCETIPVYSVPFEPGEKGSDQIKYDSELLDSALASTKWSRPSKKDSGKKEEESAA